MVVHSRRSWRSIAANPPRSHIQNSGETAEVKAILPCQRHLPDSREVGRDECAQPQPGAVPNSSFSAWPDMVVLKFLLWRERK